MINEIEALLGVLIVIIMIYFFLYKRSKVIGTFALLLVSLAMLIPFKETNYEMIAWAGIFVALTSIVAEVAIGKMGATES